MNKPKFTANNTFRFSQDEIKRANTLLETYFATNPSECPDGVRAFVNFLVDNAMENFNSDELGKIRELNKKIAELETEAQVLNQDNERLKEVTATFHQKDPHTIFVNEEHRDLVNTYLSQHKEVGGVDKSEAIFDLMLALKSVQKADVGNFTKNGKKIEI